MKGRVVRLQVVGLDHIVLNVADVEASLAFYCGELALEPVRVDEWRVGAVPFPSARISGDTIIDFVQGIRSGENVHHFCLVVQPVDFAALIEDGELDASPPGPRFGAKGTGTAVTIRDPDGNTVEVRHYG